MKKQHTSSMSHSHLAKRLVQLMVRSILFMSILSALLTACDSFTEVPLPSSQLTAPNVFEDKGTANAAMVDIYSKIRDRGLLTGYSPGLSCQLGLYADELDYYGLSGTAASNFYSNTLLASDPEITKMWNASYSQIYAANAAIEGAAKSAGLSVIDREQLTGEALFVRALLHFYLTSCFGAVPYITTTDYRQNTSVQRLAAPEVYDRIKADLEQAVTLLPEQYIGEGRVRPNKWAAQALLARVCLYMGQWDEASNAASAVLNQTELYQWPSGVDDVFGKDSLSAIWQLMPATDGANTYEGGTFIFTLGPPPAVAITEDLVNAFTNDDLRKSHWIRAVSNSGSTWYHAYKYRQKFNTGISAEYSVVLRLAEQYLIRAEARAHAGDLIGAKEDLNKTRNLAGLGNTAAITADEIIAAVMQERRLEFFTEFGHRFFDLKRTAKLNEVLSPLKPQWNAADRLFPIPESELLLNTNLLPQNEGY